MKPFKRFGVHCSWQLKKSGKTCTETQQFQHYDCKSSKAESHISLLNDELSWTASTYREMEHSN